MHTSKMVVDSGRLLRCRFLAPPSIPPRRGGEGSGIAWALVHPLQFPFGGIWRGLYEDAQGRIQAMSFRFFAVVVLVVFGAFGFVGCGVRDEGGAVGENALTAELVVPPPSQVTVEPPTATVAPTAMGAPTATSEAVEGVVEASEDERPTRVNVPNRGYNSYGDADAPITMFDFSDFL